MSGDVPASIGVYKVSRAVGVGGMGRVYLARDEALGRDVAIKVLLPDIAKDKEMSARFLREARAMAQISSPHVVTVFQVGNDDDGTPYLVMELLAGEDLSERIKREGRVAADIAVRLIIDAIDGLSAALAAGLIHRDVKPANLFVVNERLKLTDFGLARPIDGSADLTQAGLVVGTPHYLAPEVARGGEASVQSDIYALGATLFELVAGRPPFVGTSPIDVLSQHITASVPDLSTVMPLVPKALAAIVAQMLSKDPALRPKDYRSLRHALQASLTTTASATQPLSQLGSQLGSHLGSHVAPANSTSPSGTASSNTPSSNTPSSNTPSSNTPSAPMAVGHANRPGTEISHAIPQTAPTAPSSPTRDPATTAIVEQATMATSVAMAKVSGVAPVVKTAPLTVMFTDIAGYTERTGQQSREEAARWLQVHDALLQPVIKSFGGKLVKTIGDAFLATFSSPTDAVLCGMAIQDRLYVHNQTATPSDEINVRVALSAGEVRIHKGDIFGEAVNLAARLESLAKPGEVLLSDAVYATMNAAEVTLQSRGEERFKGIARSVHVYACVTLGLEGTPPFGGHLLARVNESHVARVVDAAGKAAKAADEARVRVETGLRALVAQVEPATKSLANRFGKRTTTGLAAAFGIVVVVGLGFALFGNRQLARIDDGEAQAVLDEIDALSDQERGAKHELLRGHAYFALEKRKSGMRAYRVAVDDGVVDDRARENLLAAIESKTARGLLTDWPDDDIDDDLESLLSEDWTVRHNAYYVLEARDAIDDDTATDLGLLDLKNDGCKERDFAVSLLKRRGKGSRAVRALDDAKERPTRGMNALLACRIDYDAAIDAIKLRD